MKTKMLTACIVLSFLPKMATLIILSNVAIQFNLVFDIDYLIGKYLQVLRCCNLKYSRSVIIHTLRVLMDDGAAYTQSYPGRWGGLNLFLWVVCWSDIQNCPGHYIVHHELVNSSPSNGAVLQIFAHRWWFGDPRKSARWTSGRSIPPKNRHDVIW